MTGSGNIKLNPNDAAGAFGDTAGKLGGLGGTPSGADAGVRPGFSGATNAMADNYGSELNKGAGQYQTGAAAANGLGDTDQASGQKINGGPNAQDPTGAGGRGGLGAPRMTAADLAKASPYDSPMPSSQQAANILPTLAGAAQQGAEALPKALTSPLGSLSGMAAPFQSMLSAPGGSQTLDGILARANASNGYDGGPASLAMGPGGDARLNAITKNVLGIPYAWGGGSMSGPTQGISDGGGPADRAGDYRKVGFDCSGLSRYITGQMYGVEIPRTSEAQFASGAAVSASQARPGDLVFPASAGRPPGHVQVYVGDGKVLEAPSSGQTVKISPLSGGSEFRRFHS